MIFPKRPQVLYAPMLATMGGGSANGFRSSGASADLGYWGVEYDGWDGTQLDMTESERSSFYNITQGDTDWVGLQSFLSHNLNEFYGAYQHQGYYTLTNPMNYPASPNNSNLTNYYGMNAITQFNSSYYNTGRAITIAYLGDGSPVFVASFDGTTPQKRNLRFWDADVNGGQYRQHLGDFQMTGSFPNFNFTTSNSVANFDSGEYAHMVYDGSGLIVKSRTGDDAKKRWVKIDLPTDKNIGNGCTAQYMWDIDSSLTHSSYQGSSVGNGYGAAYMGMDSDGYRYIYENSYTNGTGGRIVRLDLPTNASQIGSWLFKSATSSGGGYGVNGQDFKIPTYEYACAIDYKNKKLLTGSHANGGVWAVFDLF